MTTGEWWLFCSQFEASYRAMTWTQRGVWLMAGMLAACLIMFVAGRRRQEEGLR